MRQVIKGAQERGMALFNDGKDLLRDQRARRPWLDHQARAFERYQERRGNRLAAALTCYGFLSFFPLLALAYALLGYLVGVSDEVRGYFVEAINSLLPGLSRELQVQQIAESKTAVGVIGIAALLVTGLGWVQVLRESLRDMWGNEPDGGGNVVLLRLWDAAVLALLGVVLISGMAVSTVTTSATGTVLGWFGLQDVTGAGTVLRLLSLMIAMAFNSVIFLVLFTRLTGARAPWRRIARGALFGAVGFEILKQVAGLLISRTTENPVYASFAVLVGLMVWMNVASRFVLYVAGWTATRLVVLTAEAEADAYEEAEALDEAAEDGTDAGTDDAPDDAPDDRPGGASYENGSSRLRRRSTSSSAATASTAPAAPPATTTQVRDESSEASGASGRRPFSD
ncbi:membrane protein [Actinomadura algeriensis]|uniref:Membrane protein n=1 Tax=Actinomadura algeriensis TaxID=1679523 RepID=A0ABR9JST5_9ACTN|nr:membrane protein [Actinomadura algeriensis]